LTPQDRSPPLDNRIIPGSQQFCGGLAEPLPGSGALPAQAGSSRIAQASRRATTAQS